MNILQYEISGIPIQLFVQPSLTNVYARNNRSLMNNDFILNFPSIPLSFGLSSDLASGWSKLVYEQSLLNLKQGNQQKIEVEIQGLGPNEAHVVEECVKLLFGFKVQVTNLEVWLFLKVADMLGLTQSPLCELDSLTVQEQLLNYAQENLADINIIEGWDYVLAILEGSGNPATIHRSEIRSLALKIYQQIKLFFIKTKFEILAQYAHEPLDYIRQEVSVISSNGQQSNMKFTTKDLKREHYIQIRTQFYDYINNEQKSGLSQTQGVVKVLLDELDVHFELYGLIKTDNDVEIKLDSINQKILDQQQLYIHEINQVKEKTLSENKYLKEKQQEIKRELVTYKKKFEGMVNIKVNCMNFTEDSVYLGMSNGVVEVIDIISRESYVINHSISNDSDVQSIISLKEYTFLGMSNGQILQFKQNCRIKTFYKPEHFSSINFLMNYQDKFIIASYQDNTILIWDLNYAIIYDSQQSQLPLILSMITVAYTHVNFGDVILFGDSEGCIKFTFLNEQKNRPTLQLISQLKNGDSPLVNICNLANYTDILLSSQKEQNICVWNWGNQSLITVIKLDSICLKSFSVCINQDRLLVSLLENGDLQLYSFNQQRTAKLIQQVQSVQNPLDIIHFDEGGKFSIISQMGRQILCQISEEPLNIVILTNHKLALKSTISHHLSCVYALINLQYPLLASSSDDKMIKIFNLNTQEVIHTLKGHQAYVRALALLQDGKHLISGSYDSSVKIWQIENGSCLNTLTGHTKPVLAVKVLHHTELIFVSGGEDAVVKAWNWKLAICLWMIEMGKNEVWSLQSVKDVNTQTYGILTGHKDGHLKFVNVGNKGDQCQLEREMKIHKSFINNILNIKDQVVATASSDNLITLVNWKIGIIIRILKGHQDIIWHIDRIDDQTIVSSSTEGSIKVWDWRTGICLNTSYCSKGSIYTLQRIPSSAKLLCGTATGDILVWKILTPQTSILSKIIN